MKRNIQILVEREDASSKRSPNLKYQYRPLFPVLAEAELRAFETKYRVTLPDDYRNYLKFVGNGGGTFDLFRLGEMDDNFDYMPWDANWVGDLGAPFPHTEAWDEEHEIFETDLPDDATEEEEDAYREELDRAEEIYFDTRHVNGAIPIFHLGCSQRIWLVISGSERGNLWLDLRPDWCGLQPLKSATGERVTFYDWCRDWLDKSLPSI